MLKIVWILNFLVTTLITVSCMAQKEQANHETLKSASNESAFEIKGKDAVDFKDAIVRNCSAEAPFFRTLICLYNIDDDGNGYDTVFRSCQCDIEGNAVKFKVAKDVLRISEIMENLRIGEPGQRPSHRIYRLSSLSCLGDTSENIRCSLKK
jgi:hypothetical protein